VIQIKANQQLLGTYSMPQTISPKFINNFLSYPADILTNTPRQNHNPCGGCNNTTPFTVVFSK